MSKYTLQLRNYLDSFSFSLENEPPELTLDERIDTGIPHLFDFQFPWYDTSAAHEGLADFKKLFCIHFYMMEIGFETIALFKLNLRDVLCRVMPKYEQLYLSTKFDYDPLINHVFDSTYSDSGTQSANGHSVASGSSQSLNSDVPQVNFSGRDFASGLVRGESGAQNTSNSSGTDSKEGSRHDEGFTGGSRSIEIARWRQNILNLNSSLIDECEDLFMGVYDMSQLIYNDYKKYVGYNPHIRKGGLYSGF